MPKVDLESIEQTNRTGYPPPFNEKVAGRHYRRLASALALEGEAVLIENEGETVLRPGDVAVFPKGVANAHHLINRSGRTCRLIAVGKPAASDCHYPDIDLHLDGQTQRYTHRDGTPY